MVYIVVQTYKEDGEQWATIQKQNTQFRKKQYEVKMAELLLLPGQATRGILDNDDIPEKDTVTDSYNIEKEDTICRRPERAAAKQAKQRMANLHKVTSIKKPTTPLHGWDYQMMMELWHYDSTDTLCTLISPEENQQHYINDENQEDYQQLEDNTETEHSIISSEAPTSDTSVDSSTMTEDETI